MVRRMIERVQPKDATIPVLIEALFNCGCPVARNLTIGECAETVCGCSIHAERLQGCMGAEHTLPSKDTT